MNPFPWIEGGQAWPMVQAEDIVKAARGWIGTPWAHDQRCKGHGVDCVGLLVGALEDCGVTANDQRGYTRGDEYARMVSALAEHCEEVTGEWWPGDVLVFRRMDRVVTSAIANHVAIYTGPESDGMVHAWATSSIKAVCEHPLNKFWRDSVSKVFRYRGTVWPH